MRTRLRTFAIVSALPLVLLAGCSKSSSSEGTAATGPQGWTRLSPAQLQDRMQQGDVFLVNVHVPYEGEITGTDMFIPYTDIAQRIGDLPADRSTLVLYCRSGNMSTQAAQALVDAGVTGFAELEGGFYAWQAAGLPFVVTPNGG